jgi:hypothetical protein
MISGQAFSHNRIIAGYRALQVSVSSSNRIRAADPFGAGHISFTARLSAFQSRREGSHEVVEWWMVVLAYGCRRNGASR